MKKTEKDQGDETMERTAIFLPKNQKERLKAVARGRKLAEMIRQAIDDFLAKEEKK